MDEAISLSIDNAKNTADEIAYLRQQLIIASTLIVSFPQKLGFMMLSERDQFYR